MKVARVLSWALVGACVAIGAAAADETQMQAPAYALPQELVSAATAFQGYMTSAAKIDAAFSDDDAVAKGLKTASSYEPSQLEEGMIAYGAIVALQDERFVAGVEHAAGHGDDRAKFAEQLVEDPGAAARVDGADEAARRIEAAIGGPAAALGAAGERVSAAAYAVQGQTWSKTPVGDAQARLADIEARSSAAATPSDDESRAMLAAIIGAGDPAAAGKAGAHVDIGAVETRALALAAESVLGRARSADRDWLSPLVSEPGSAECLRMAKLDLYQCMAVAGPEYQDIYCMGRHALSETARCVAPSAAGTGATQVASLAADPAGAERAEANSGGYRPLATRQKLGPNN